MAMKKGILKKSPTPLVRLARRAQVDGNFSELGRIINRANSITERGCLLGMLACEIALRKKDLRMAKRILNMARQCFADDYENLVVAKRQAALLPLFIEDEPFIASFMQQRAKALQDGLI